MTLGLAGLCCRLEPYAASLKSRLEAGSLPFFVTTQLASAEETQRGGAEEEEQEE